MSVSDTTFGLSANRRARILPAGEVTMSALLLMLSSSGSTGLSVADASANWSAPTQVTFARVEVSRSLWSLYYVGDWARDERSPASPVNPSDARDVLLIL